MRTLLKTFDSTLIQNEVRALNFLNPPIIDRTLLTQLVYKYYGKDFNIPIELYELYEWHDGTGYTNREDDEQSNYYLFPGYCFLSLAEIEDEIRHKNFYEWIDNKVIPLFSTLNGEYLAINIRSGHENNIFYNQMYDPTLKQYSSCYDNLATMVRTIIRCYDEGCYSYMNDYYNEDMDISYKISKEMNPKSDRWKEG